MNQLLPQHVWRGLFETGKEQEPSTSKQCQQKAARRGTMKKYGTGTHIGFLAKYSAMTRRKEAPVLAEALF
jgi:hypothetical protein